MQGAEVVEESDQASHNFDLVSRYLGWGDPTGHGLWFIGIEEGSYSYESAADIPPCQCEMEHLSRAN